MCCQAPLTENFIYNLISLFYLFFSESYCIIFKRHGELAEWSKAHDWKSCLRGTVTRVQIPNSPPRKKPLLSTKTREVFSCFQGQNSPQYRKYCQNSGWNGWSDRTSPCFLLFGGEFGVLLFAFLCSAKKLAKQHTTGFEYGKTQRCRGKVTSKPCKSTGFVL